MPEISFPNWSTPERHTDLKIYKLGRPVVNERSLRRIANSFGMPVRGKDGRIEIDSSKISYSVGSNVVTLYRTSGALRYHDGSRWQVDDGYSEVRIPEADAAVIARRYIEATALAPLAECQLAAVTRLRVGVANLLGDEREERVIDLGIIFQRLVDGTPVDGPGGKVVVYLDAAGEITGVDRTWRPIHSVLRNVVALRPREEVAQRIRRFWGRSVLVAVEEVRFGYFEQGLHTLQRTLQPAYVVMVNVRAEEHGLRRRAVYVQPAATNSIGVLQPARSRQAPQPERSRDMATGH
jgi:hypothetical protein